jgi:hypothetical protein
MLQTDKQQDASELDADFLHNCTMNYMHDMLGYNAKEKVLFE